MLGVIGGMGPSASSLFYDMIIEKTGAKRDQENIDMILLSHASMPDRTRAILSGDESQISDVSAKILKDALFLQNAGAEAICVTCNTAHYFVDRIANQVEIPFIHMIRGVAEKIAQEETGEKIAILATRGTLRTRLYQTVFDQYGITYWVPDEGTENEVMKEIYDYVKAGKPADKILWENVESKVREQGCDRALLGCTELPIVKKELGLGEFYVDPMEVMAENAVAFMKDEKKQRSSYSHAI